MIWSTLAPELVFLAAALGCLGLALVKLPRDNLMWQTALALAGLGLAACLATVTAEGLFFGAALRVDLFSQVFKLLIALGLLLLVAVCPLPAGIDRNREGEYYSLLFSCALALLLMVSSVHLLTFYVSLELSSYALYVLVALREGREDTPGCALHFFLVGISASALTLFGMALIYGQLGTANLAEIAAALMPLSKQPSMAAAWLLMLAGVFFKLALFPFHFWAPDAYGGAPNPVATFIATASKVAAIGVLLRLTMIGRPLGAYLVPVLATLAVLSMTVGNLAALAQKDLKRLFAYSSVAHAGYVLLGILCLNQSGATAVVFYALALLLMKFTCFLVVLVEAPDGRNLAIADLAGLHQRQPALTLALMMALFSLAGIPPTVGFTGKLMIFMAAVEQGWLPLVIIAMINVVISLYYYLMVLRAAYLLEAPQTANVTLPQPALPMRWIAIGLVGSMVLTGIWPGPLLDMVYAAARCLG